MASKDDGSTFAKSMFDDTEGYFSFWLDKIDEIYKMDMSHEKILSMRNAVGHITDAQYNQGLLRKLAAIPNAVQRMTDAALWFEDLKKTEPTKCTTPLPGMLHAMGYTVPGTPFEHYYGELAVKHEPMAGPLELNYGPIAAK